MHTHYINLLQKVKTCQNLCTQTTVLFGVERNVNIRKDAVLNPTHTKLAAGHTVLPQVLEPPPAAIAGSSPTASIHMGLTTSM